MEWARCQVHNMARTYVHLSQVSPAKSRACGCLRGWPGAPRRTRVRVREAQEVPLKSFSYPSPPYCWKPRTLVRLYPPTLTRGPTARRHPPRSGRRGRGGYRGCSALRHARARERSLLGGKEPPPPRWLALSRRCDFTAGAQYILLCLIRPARSPVTMPLWLVASAP